MIRVLYNVLDKVMVKDRVLFTAVFDVTNTIYAVNSFVSIHHNDMRVYNCGWVESPRIWAIRLKANDKEWRKIVNSLNVMRIWSTKELPTCIMNGVYSTD